jgi:hypothetical protein
VSEIVPERPGSVWEDGVGTRDGDARVLSEERAAHTPDPQSTRYGQGEPGVVVQAVVSGPAFRRRPVVDVRWHEGLRPMYMRMRPEEARRIGQMLLSAAARAESEGAPSGSA